MKDLILHCIEHKKPIVSLCISPILIAKSLEESNFSPTLTLGSSQESSEYNISDIAVHSWYGTLVLNNAYNASEFLEVESYKHVGRWAKQIIERPAYKRGSLVNKKPNGPDDKSILERHDASDIKL